MFSLGNKEERHKKWSRNFISESDRMLDDYKEMKEELGKKHGQISTDEITYGIVYRLMEHSERLGTLTKALIVLTCVLIALAVRGFISP